jgi:hypothetical protein
VNSGIIAKRLAFRTIVPMASFGFRTMLWIWAGEMFYSSVFMLFGFTIIYALITYINNDSLSYAFSPIILLSSSYFIIVYEKLYSIFFPTVVSSYGIIHWSIEFYFFIVSLNFYHEFNLLCEILNRNDLHGLSEMLGFYTGLLFCYGIAPVLEILYVPVRVYEGSSIMSAFGEVGWVNALREISVCVVSVVLSDFHLLMDTGLTLPILSNDSFIIDEIISPQAPSSVDSPWADDSTPKASTSKLPDYEIYFKDEIKSVDTKDVPDISFFGDSGVPDVIDYQTTYHDRFRMIWFNHHSFYLSGISLMVVISSRIYFGI